MTVARDNAERELARAKMAVTTLLVAMWRVGIDRTDYQDWTTMDQAVDRLWDALFAAEAQGITP